jgi:hypothetical protein
MHRVQELRPKTMIRQWNEQAALSFVRIYKNTEVLIVASKEIGLEVNANKTKYVITSRDQPSGQNHNIKTDNKSLERAEQFKYLGTTVPNRNSIHKEIKSRLKSRNACYKSVQNLLSYRLLSKNIRNYNFASCFIWV